MNSIPDYDEALRIAEEIEDLAESPDLPSAGVDFAESVSEKAASIAETIEDTGEVTDAQWNALNNMLAGLRRWFRY